MHLQLISAIFSFFSPSNLSKAFAHLVFVLLIDKTNHCARLLVLHFFSLSQKWKASGTLICEFSYLMLETNLRISLHSYCCRCCSPCRFCCCCSCCSVLWREKLVHSQRKQSWFRFSQLFLSFPIKANLVLANELVKRPGFLCFSIWSSETTPNRNCTISEISVRPENTHSERNAQFHVCQWLRFV